MVFVIFFLNLWLRNYGNSYRLKLSPRYSIKSRYSWIWKWLLFVFAYMLIDKTIRPCNFRWLFFGYLHVCTYINFCIVQYFPTLVAFQFEKWSLPYFWDGIHKSKVSVSNLINRNFKGLLKLWHLVSYTKQNVSHLKLQAYDLKAIYVELCLWFSLNCFLTILLSSEEW